MYHRQQFPLRPVRGNGLGQSLFLMVNQEHWSALLDSHSFEAHSCEQFRRRVRFLRFKQDNHFLMKWSKQSFPRENSFSPGCTLFSAGGMAQIGEWSRFNNHERHSSGKTHSLQVTLCLVSEEWPRVGNGPDSYSLRADSFSPSYTSFSVGGMAQGGE